MRKVIIITGPTASGKSTLAIKLALCSAGEIVNADSMQVYRDMDVGTAKVPVMERNGVPHHLLDVVDPDEDFNAALYRSLALPLIKDILSRKKVCIIAGGTGLYIKTLLGGLLHTPPADPEIRKKLSHECEVRGTAYLYKRLKMLDPESAHIIHPNDRMRIIRALEIIHLTQKRLSDLKRCHGFRDNAFKALKICLHMGREKLYRRINQRCLDMIESGLLEEVEGLLRRGYSSDLKPMKSIGYRHMVKFLDGEYDMDKAIGQLQTDTRRYAKRQLTWFRSDPEMVWKRPEDFDSIIKEIEHYKGDRS
ncbi:MAG: tRNA (adenosine(37)-N6)-dimethylallyltransferase MiaA [Thermodesulfobacteriota bacterium]|nr:tRNA (adenosine(37)-N6)-dimethylallyltransferase MiaA [Thermodesulfobacteriota bacterium]